MSDSTTILALDPGEKVGWARAVVNPDGTWDNLMHGITPLREMALAIGEKLELGEDFGVTPWNPIVVESYRLSAAKASSQYGSDLPTVQFVGMVRYLGWKHGINIVMQGPSIKRTADKTAPPWLQEIIDNEPKTHDDAHNVDALRHLWFWTWNAYVANEAVAL